MAKRPLTTYLAVTLTVPYGDVFRLLHFGWFVPWSTGLSFEFPSGFRGPHQAQALGHASLYHHHDDLPLVVMGREGSRVRLVVGRRRTPKGTMASALGMKTTPELASVEVVWCGGRRKRLEEPVRIGVAEHQLEPGFSFVLPKEAFTLRGRVRPPEVAATVQIDFCEDIGFAQERAARFATGLLTGDRLEQAMVVPDGVVHAAKNPHLPVEGFGRLMRCLDRRVRHALYANPSLPSYLLPSAAREAPEILAANPSLPVYRLTDPGLLHLQPARLTPRARRLLAIDETPHAPPR